MDHHQALNVHEIASNGLKSMEDLIRLISTHSKNNQLLSPVDFRHLYELIETNPTTTISGPNRTGHARFRRGPIFPSPLVHRPHKLMFDFANANIVCPTSKNCLETGSTSQYSMGSSANSSFLSSITGDRSVSNGKNLIASTLILDHGPEKVYAMENSSQLSSQGCQEHNPNSILGKLSNSFNGCHCSKTMNLKVRKSIKVPAISSKMADIPADEHSWRKYGQKPIKGSPYPRGYYKCSTFKSCPAKKHVEKAKEDPTMLIITYEGEHKH
ncbi:probable WRKY transcription factor 11 [Impatiens glandulifera]|uniref:probable WRKY transcription factor 11 n=1 Tax=Impatiens glandulifera TaxID=253017 RepID=UPI001FB060C2|nr:probable WRKY transcription factor 11 [Impatiens glandulifera]